MIRSGLQERPTEKGEKRKNSNVYKQRKERKTVKRTIIAAKMNQARNIRNKTVLRMNSGVISVYIL